MAIRNILLLSEDFVKSNSNLSDNVFGKFLLPAIRESQEVYLQEIIGSALYQSILEKIKDNALTDPYKEFVDDYVRWYLLYRVLADVIDILDVKLANLGTVRSRDEYVDNIGDGERDRLKQNYQYKADFYCRRMQEFLLNNRNAFVELDECVCDRLNAQLNSSASTGIFLGGYRSYILPK